MYDLDATISVPDFSRAIHFWTPILNTLGWPLQHQFPGLQIFGPSSAHPYFCIAEITTPASSPASQDSSTSSYISARPIYLSCADSEEVEALYRKAVQQGARKVLEPDMYIDKELAPFTEGEKSKDEEGEVEGWKEECRFLGRFLDLDGNLVEVSCVESESQGDRSMDER